MWWHRSCEQDLSQLDEDAWCINQQGAFYQHWLTLIPVWISNYIHDKVWDEIAWPFPNFNGAAVEVWEWISDFIPDFIMDVITYPTCNCKYASEASMSKDALKMHPWHFIYKLQIGHLTLTTLTGISIPITYLWVKLRKIIWSSSTRSWNLPSNFKWLT